MPPKCSIFKLVIVAVILILIGLNLYQYRETFASWNKTKNTDTQTSYIDLKFESLEIADSPEERARGMMYRQLICDTCGILFVFEYSEDLAFWMRNTYIPLDIIFIDEHEVILNIEENAEPLNDKKIYKSKAPAKYVLEVKSGYSKSKDLKAGNRLNINEMINTGKDYKYITN